MTGKTQWRLITAGVTPDPSWPAGYEPIPEVSALLADREKDYGSPVQNFERIAGMWRALFGWDVTASQVGLAMICVKQSRELHSHKDDNLADIDGYVECIRLIEATKP